MFYQRINLFFFVAFMGLSPSLVQAEQGSAVACIEQAQDEALNSWARQSPRYSCSPARNESLIMGEALTNIAECLEMDWRKVFPKLLAESGFIADIRGAGGDRGVGQVTLPAIRDIQQNQALFWQKILQSPRPSCRKVESRVRSWGGPKAFFDFSPNEPCQVIAGDIGIYRNIFFSLALSKLNEAYIERAYSDLEISALLKSAGYANAPHQKIRSLLLILGYNGGGRSAVVDLRNYLLSRIDFIHRKSRELEKAQIRADQYATFLHYVSARDFDFKMGQNKFQKLLQSLPPELNQEQKSQALRNISASLLGFPEWLRIWQKSGGPGYVNGVFLRGAQFSQQFPACVNLSDFEI